ncbi:tripartite motif-containing protein 2-like [Saccostrea echinata]|uniref:tripartite motif-containing protein 2-like n=1 Tax=Saccostrea echinata TaxID=191078 RepID=UPI002A8262B0|nr:tripartite motif-containing protein 2-like [Saccostrea echinata]
MALSKMDKPHNAQHFLECDIEECERNCEFYCNLCHQRLCKQCSEEHLKSPVNKNHEVVLYQQRKRQFPVEKCKIHPNKDIDMLCEECQVSVCSKCATQGDHRGHIFTDLETIYAEKCAVFQEEFRKIHEYFLPTSQDLQREIKKDSSDIRHIMDNIRTSMKTEGESLKSLVDTVVSENMKQLDQIEHSLLDDLNTQDKTLDDYITYLNNLVKELHGCLFSTEPQKLMSEKKPKIQSIPEIIKPVTPGFTAGQYSKFDVTKLLGEIHVPNTKAEKREIRPFESVHNTTMKPTQEQKEEDREKSDKKQTISLSASVSKVREFNVPGVDDVYHISLDQSDRLWISDSNGNLVQTDLQGNEIQKIETSGGDEGYHTVTQDGDLIFTDQDTKVIYRITQDNNITEFIKTEDWEPLSIHSSHINGDILVGMVRVREAKGLFKKGKKKEKSKITRYNKTGKELQNIQRDNKGQKLYNLPHYITENINGDICTSDFDIRAVVVVNKSGQHRFSYTGQESEFLPYGICTDVLGHILVCDGFFHSNTVHILDQDGQILSLLLTQQQGVHRPCSVCVDEENNLYVGQVNNTLTVYKYLQ